MSARDPLGPDEQALAGRLHEWSVAEPSVTLDQRILAQARAAVARPVRRPRPLLVGLASAATLVLAVGVVWRVLEAPSPGLPSAPAPAPQMRADGPTAASDPVPAKQTEQPVESVAPPAPLQRPQQQAVPKPALRTGADRAEAQVPEPVAVPAAPPARALQERLPAAPGVPREPPPPPPPQSPARSDGARSGTGAVPTLTSPRTREVAPAAEAMDRSGSASESLVDAIGRIRALVARGQVDAARRAIDVLRKQHPETVLPPDLAAIEVDPRR